MPHVLVVEDDPNIAAGLVSALRGAGHAVALCVDGLAGAQAALSDAPDLVILDLMLPGQDGFEVLRQIRSRSAVPVVVLTARTELDDRLQSFGLGADDYLGKPFWTEELLARVHARLGHRPAEQHHTVDWLDVSVDLTARAVRQAGEAVSLTAHEFNLLAALVQRPGRALSRGQLAELALPLEGERAPRTVDSHISRVRRKLGEAGKAVRTVWGIGYRFEP